MQSEKATFMSGLFLFVITISNRKFGILRDYTVGLENAYFFLLKVEDRNCIITNGSMYLHSSLKSLYRQIF